MPAKGEADELNWRDNRKDAIMPDLPIPQAGRDTVTPLVAAVLRDAGPAAYERLVVSPGPGAGAKSLGAVRPEQLFCRPVKHADDAAAALAGLWLWHDALDECHKIVQDIASPTGSMWHAIMHRREGDFSNSKYWYARCETHHVNKLLGAVASSIVGQMHGDGDLARVLSGGWNPRGFVDLVESVYNKPGDPRYPIAVKLQRAEWEALFDYCAREAVEADRNNLDDWDKRAGKLGAGM